MLFSYACWLFAYLAGMAVLWALGIEAIYGHPTPFHVLFRPIFDAWAAPVLLRELREPLLAMLVFGVFLTLALLGARQAGWFSKPLSRRAVGWMLVGAIVFLVLFSSGVAMFRGGVKGITDAYDRQTYEYIGDIGKGRTIAGLFRDYNRIHPYLSMHAKVHPPGPIALLWLLSFLTGGANPLPLSIATIFVGALGLIPLYYWARDLTNPRTALTCCFLYACIPSIVLFTATSADILFTPFTLTTLFLFGRALERPSMAYALGAGAGYAIMSLLSFSLLGFGAYFAFIALWRLYTKRQWRAAIQTAACMLAAFIVVHALFRWWTGFDYIACFHLAREQFITDQLNLDIATPRYAAIWFRLLNPLCWLYFAGIPVSLLFFSQLRKPESSIKGLFLVFLLTLIALNFLYLARGEGERSALYIFPLLALPAAHGLDRLGEKAGSYAPLAAVCAFLAFQCMLTEALFYSYW